MYMQTENEGNTCAHKGEICVDQQCCPLPLTICCNSSNIGPSHMCDDKNKALHRNILLRSQYTIRVLVHL